MLHLYITIYYLQSLNHCLMEKPVRINIGFQGWKVALMIRNHVHMMSWYASTYSVPNTTLSSLPSLFESGFLLMSYQEE